MPDISRRGSAVLTTITVVVSIVLVLAPQFKVRAMRATTGSLPLIAPATDGATVSGTYLFAVDAGSLPNVASVEFDIGSLRLGVAQSPPYQIGWNTAYGKDGNYAVQAIARDAFGHVIATGERLFNIENHGATIDVSSPDLSQELSGIVTLQAPAYDPANYPAIFHLFIDGEKAGYWDVGSASAAHNKTAVFKIDTTRFSNGTHELVIAVNAWKEATSPHTYTNYSAMADRNITIKNAHSLMEVAADYQTLYLRPGEVLRLSCRQLFTDNTSGPCRAPAYSSQNAAVAYVSNSGVVEGINNGFTTAVVTESGKTATVAVWVKSDFNIPHFSGSGQLLNSYDPGNSIFPVAPFGLDPMYMQSGDVVNESRRAGFNTLTFALYRNTRSTATPYEDWKRSQDQTLTSRIQWAKDNDFYVIATGDDAFRRPGDDAQWTLNWPFGRQATQYAMETLAGSGIGIALEVVDEAAALWGWYPVHPSKVGQQGLPGQPASFQSVACSGGVCTVQWPKHGYGAGRWIAFQGSTHPELNTEPGRPFIVQRTTENSFDFLPNAPITGTLTSSNDPNLEMMLFAAWPCNAGTTDGRNHPCVPFTANDAVKTYSNWLRQASPRVPFSWPALGIMPAAVHANWTGQPAVDGGISDYASHYWDVRSGSRTYSWSNGVQQRTFWMKDAFYSRQPYTAQDRPQLMLVCGSSFAYTKRAPGSAYYDPLVDTLDQPGCDGPIAAAEIMTAAALGNAGVRQYQYDAETPGRRAAYAVGKYLQTGMRPDATERNAKEIWQAAGYASNLLTKVLQPYILGSAAASPAYQRNITTAVRRGTDAIMLMIVNGNDGDRTVSVDFRPYKSVVADITRYRLSYSYLRSDVVADSNGEVITLPKGGSVVYLFPFSRRTKFLQPVLVQPTLPARTAKASVAYNYIYSDHLPQLTDNLTCNGGCLLHVDTRLGDVYYQFTYTDADGRVLGRSSVGKLRTIRDRRR